MNKNKHEQNKHEQNKYEQSKHDLRDTNKKLKENKIFIKEILKLPQV